MRLTDLALGPLGADLRVAESAADGRFSIDRVPAAAQTLCVAPPALGVCTQLIAMRTGGDVAVTVPFSET